MDKQFEEWFDKAQAHNFPSVSMKLMAMDIIHTGWIGSKEYSKEVSFEDWFNQKQKHKYLNESMAFLAKELLRLGWDAFIDNQ